MRVSSRIIATGAAAGALVLTILAACGGEKDASKKSTTKGASDTTVTLTFDAYADKSADGFKIYVQKDSSSKLGLDTESSATSATGTESGTGTASGTGTGTGTSTDKASGSDKASSWTLVKSITKDGGGFDVKSPSVTLTLADNPALKDFVGTKVCFAITAYSEDAESDRSKSTCVDF